MPGESEQGSIEQHTISVARSLSRWPPTVSLTVTQTSDLLGFADHLPMAEDGHVKLVVHVFLRSSDVVVHV